MAEYIEGKWRMPAFKVMVSHYLIHYFPRISFKCALLLCHHLKYCISKILYKIVFSFSVYQIKSEWDSMIFLTPDER